MPSHTVNHAWLPGNVSSSATTSTVAAVQTLVHSTTEVQPSASPRLCTNMKHVQSKSSHIKRAHMASFIRKKMVWTWPEQPN